MVKYTLDRFEGDYAVCENRETKEIMDILISKIPKNAQEGDMLVFANGEYIIDNEVTKVSRENIQALMKKLRKKD